MTPSMKVGIAGIVLGLILLAILPAWAAIAIIVIAAAIPVGGYLALDKGQRRRIEGDPRPRPRPLTHPGGPCQSAALTTPCST